MPGLNEKDQQAIEQLSKMAGAFQNSRVLLLAVELGIFDELSQGVRNSVELAKTLELKERAVEIVLHALVALELVVKKDGYFENSEIAEAFLVKDKPHSLAYIMRHRAEMFRSWAMLDTIVKEGRAVEEFEKATLSDPEINRHFILGMAEVSRARLGPIVDRLPLNDGMHFVDIGGGPAHYCIEVVKRYAKARASLVDLSLTADVAKEEIQKAGVESLVETLVCDFYREETIPLKEKADCVLLSQVLHAEGKAENQALLKKISAQMNEGASLVVVENMISQNGYDPKEAALFAVNMLAGTSRGRTYSQAEISAWLVEAGLTIETYEEIAPRTQMLIAKK